MSEPEFEDLIVDAPQDMRWSSSSGIWDEEFRFPISDAAVFVRTLGGVYVAAPFIGPFVEIRNEPGLPQRLLIGRISDPAAARDFRGERMVRCVAVTRPFDDLQRVMEVVRAVKIAPPDSTNPRGPASVEIRPSHWQR